MRITISVAALALASCVSPVEEWKRPQYEFGARTITPTSEALPAPLPGVVDAPAPGSITEGSPTHDVEQTSSGRMHILELYQRGIEEREALEAELAGLTRSLERAELEIARLSGELAESEAQAGALREERDRLLTESEELASRLVTAQIRRLEAEKVLLEAKLEWHRAGSTAVEAKSGSKAGESAMERGHPR